MCVLPDQAPCSGKPSVHQYSITHQHTKLPDTLRPQAVGGEAGRHLRGDPAAPPGGGQES